MQMESKRASPSSVKSSQDANLILATVFPPLEAHSDSVWPARLCSEGKIVSKSEPVQQDNMCQLADLLPALAESGGG